MSAWLLRISIFLWASSKFLVGSSMAVALLSPLEGFIWTLFGGVAGCFLWIFGGKYLQTLWTKWFNKNNRSRLFTKKNRFLVRLRMKGGLYLIALLTPLILSIPAGCLFSVNMESNPYKVLRIQSLSVLFWSIIIFGGKSLYRLF